MAKQGGRQILAYSPISVRLYKINKINHLSQAGDWATAHHDLRSNYPWQSPTLGQKGGNLCLLALHWSFMSTCSGSVVEEIHRGQSKLRMTSLLREAAWCIGMDSRSPFRLREISLEAIVGMVLPMAPVVQDKHNPSWGYSGDPRYLCSWHILRHRAYKKEGGG